MNLHPIKGINLKHIHFLLLLLFLFHNHFNMLLCEGINYEIPFLHFLSECQLIYETFFIIITDNKKKSKNLKKSSTLHLLVG